jgi:hypothetical protein
MLTEARHRSFAATVPTPPALHGEPRPHAPIGKLDAGHGAGFALA